MIAGQPFAPPAIPSKQQPTTASLFTRFVRYLPALALSLLCLASASCVLLLVLLPTAGLTAPFGHAHDLRSVMAPVAGYCILTGYACVWALAVASALAVVRTPPGHIPLWLYSREPGDQAYFHNVLQAVEKKLDGSLRFCRKCGAFKPDLAHHSKELGLCILTYQHWDLWANNAIGFYNHKTYLLTLGYSAFAHLLGALLLLPGVLRAEIGLSELPGRTILAVWHGGEASVTSYACLSLTASLILGGFSLYAAATTQHAFSVFFAHTRVSSAPLYTDCGSSSTATSSAAARPPTASSASSAARAGSRQSRPSPAGHSTLGQRATGRARAAATRYCGCSHRIKGSRAMASSSSSTSVIRSRRIWAARRRGQSIRRLLFFVPLFCWCPLQRPSVERPSLRDNFCDFHATPATQRGDCALL